MFHIHRWSKWIAWDHYVDTSYGDHAPSTQLIRRCRCGMIQKKGLWGVTLPLDPSAGGAA